MTLLHIKLIFVKAAIYCIFSGHSVLWVPCRHHSSERHVKKAYKAHMNEPTVGPTHPFYKRFKLEWKNIDANQKKDSWYAIPNTSNDYIESKRVEAVTYLKKMLDENVFPRNDYRQVNIFLGNVNT